MRLGSQPRAIFYSDLLGSVMTAAGLFFVRIELLWSTMLVAFTYEPSLASVQPLWPSGIANRFEHFGIGCIAALRVGYGSRGVVGLVAVCSSGTALDRSN